MLAVVLPFAALAAAGLAARSFAASSPAAVALIEPEDVDAVEGFWPRETDLGVAVVVRVRGVDHAARVVDFERPNRAWVDVRLEGDPLNAGRVIRLAPGQLIGPPPIGELGSAKEILEDVQSFPLKVKVAVVAVAVVGGAMLLSALQPKPTRGRA